MLNDVADKKQKTSGDFDKARDFYHENATVQKEIAGRLIASLEPWKDILPPGPVLELGCGTGFLSQELQHVFEQRPLIFSDISPGMLESCQKHVTPEERISFELLDAEKIPVEEPTYAMTISNFVAQWFRHPAYTLGQWLDVTKPGGLLLAAFLGSDCFPEWRKCAEEPGLPFTANPLPDTEEMVVKLSSDSTQVDYYEDTVTQKFSHAADFFQHLKKIGAGRQLEGRHLSRKEMKLLVKHWDSQQEGDITVSYHVVFLAVKKNMV